MNKSFIINKTITCLFFYICTTKTNQFTRLPQSKGRFDFQVTEDFFSYLVIYNYIIPIRLIIFISSVSTRQLLCRCFFGLMLWSDNIHLKYKYSYSSHRIIQFLVIIHVFLCFAQNWFYLRILISLEARLENSFFPFSRNIINRFFSNLKTHFKFIILKQVFINITFQYKNHR